MRGIYTGDDVEEINNMYKPDENIKIARYFDLPKFMDLIENKELCFNEITNFEDKYEDGIPDVIFNEWTDKSKEGYKPFLEVYRKSILKYVSCWNEFEFENYALWKIYTNKNDGICITTTVNKLKKYIEEYNSDIYKVNYIPMNNKEINVEPPKYFSQSGSIIPSSFPVLSALKYKMYSYEEEIRAIIFKNVNKREEKRPYIKVKIDLEEFIDDVYVNPYASTWYYDLIKKIVNETYGLKKEIKRSKILI